MYWPKYAEGNKNNPFPNAEKVDVCTWQFSVYILSQDILFLFLTLLDIFISLSNMNVYAHQWENVQSLVGLFAFPGKED